MSFAVISICAEDGKEICSFKTDDDVIPCNGSTVRFYNEGKIKELGNSHRYLGFVCSNVIHKYGAIYKGISEMYPSYHDSVRVILRRNRDLDYTEPKTESK